MMILSRLSLFLGLLAGLVSVAHAVPVDHTTNANGSHSPTPAESPHPPASPGRSQTTTTNSSTAEKPQVTVFFMYDSEYGGTGTAR
ncbi:hypothetical protein F5879DRAFT_990738 [Lentinula edodes]|nr:hypothetical protein F5879DRAFT_990738 [Lentinula edodes]